MELLNKDIRVVTRKKSDAELADKGRTAAEAGKA
jgi:hypothetical protein